MNIFNPHFWFNLFGREYTEQDLPKGWVLVKNDLGEYKAFSGDSVTCVHNSISVVAREAVEIQEGLEIKTKASTWRRKNAEGKWWP